MKYFNAILFVFLTFSAAIAQEHFSIHYLDKEKYKVDKFDYSLQKLSDKPILPLNTNVSKNLSANVFGYFPDWEYVNGSQQYFRYDLLTHIACFDFPVSTTGNISNPVSWPWTNVINKAHSAGVKIIMVVTNFEKDEIRKIITDAASKNTFISNVLIKLQTYKMDGINVDFEGLYSADRGSRIVNFMSELSDSVHAHYPDAEVSFASPAVNWNGTWDLDGLANACDYLFIMGYDFFGKWSDNSGPSAPLTGGSINITNSLSSQYASIVASRPEKLILGVPYFGAYFKTENSSPGSKVTEYVRSPRFRDAQAQANVYGRLWSSTYQTPWYRWNDGEWNQVWYDDYASLGLKYDLAASKNLKGVGMWALGYDGERQELWNLINYKFGSGVIPPPDMPEAFRITADSDSTLKIQFDVSASATNYLLMLSLNGTDFSDTVEVFSNDLLVEGLEPQTAYYFKIAAKNESGLSRVSEVLCGVPADSADTEVLVVNGFDRITSTDNTFDFIRFYAKPIMESGYSFVSASNEAVFKGRIDLSDYKTVIWALGDESTADETFNQFEQDSVKSFLNNGGNFFVSGSEIGWDLGRSSTSSPNDIDFYSNYLKARYVNDAPEGSKATYYSAEPIRGGIFDGMSSLNFDNGTHGTFDVDWPDAFRAANGATEDLKFVGVSAAKGVAGISYHGRFPEGNINGSLIHLSIPFETIYPESKRIELMKKAMEYFSTIVSVKNDLKTPESFALYQNYPNPFNPSTTIKFYSPVMGSVVLRIINSLGQIILIKNYDRLSSGAHEFLWNGRNASGQKSASGVYIYQVIFNDESGNMTIQSKKMILVK